jgi:GNAT superfamily N-acetyltransferase
MVRRSKGEAARLVVELPVSDTPIERLSPPGSRSDTRDLAELLVQAVEAGAAVSFVSPFDRSRAEAWWQATLAEAQPRAIFLVARDEAGIVGTVQVQPAWAPNQSHRGEVVKLLVHSRVQRRGLGADLMNAIEAEARAAGYRLLTLDTKRGDPAERLYRKLGWNELGMIPGYAMNPDGTPHDAVFFWKEIST